ncbi:universal stress protein [Isoalcanivorax beigongshangi]|uniref:Universal stress protein n=1 Tax=Isoalcanivorax beigongshangi TaxID=3238810 RepID=A0ABV4AJD3_9GAMM
MTPVLAVLEPDLKCPQMALLKAAHLAQENRRRLRIFVNIYAPALVRATNGSSEHFERAKASLEHSWRQRIAQLLQDCSECRSEVEILLAWEKDDESALRDVILADIPECVVIQSGDEGTTGLSRLLLTPRHWILLRKAPCPVMCVSSLPWRGAVDVLAAVDPDQDEGALAGLNAEVVKAARHFSDALDGTLRLAHVIEHPDDNLLLIVGEGLPTYTVDMKSVRDYYVQRLNQLCEQAGLEHSNQVLLEGEPAQALAAYQSEHAPQLLVLGTVQRDPLRRLLFGSTAEKIALNAQGDFLAVKPDGFQSPWQD